MWVSLVLISRCGYFHYPTLSPTIPYQHFCYDCICMFNSALMQITFYCIQNQMRHILKKKTIWYPYEINTLILMNTGVECRRKRLHNSTRSSALNFHTTKTHTRRMSIYADDFVRAICFCSRFTFIRHRRRLANDGFQTK